MSEPDDQSDDDGTVEATVRIPVYADDLTLSTADDGTVRVQVTVHLDAATVDIGPADPGEPGAG